MFRKWCMYGGRYKGMSSPSDLLDSSKTHWNFSGRRSRPLVSWSSLHYDTTTGCRYSVFFSCVAMSLRNPVIVKCSFGAAGVKRGVLLLYFQPQNHYLACLSACRDRRTSVTLGTFSNMVWRKARILSQSLVMASVSWYYTAQTSFLFSSIFLS